MPSPSYYVTFIDANGDDWPVRVFGTNLSHTEIVDAARRQVILVAETEPRFAPVEPIADIVTECWNGAELKH